MVRVVFWILVASFFLVLSEFFVPVVRDLFEGSLLFLLPIGVFSLLGGALVFFTVKEKIKGKFGKFLKLAGFCASGFLVFVVLHNLFYALEMLTKSLWFLSNLMGFLHAAFFIIAVVVCPLGFLLGVVGSVFYMRKKDKGK